MWQPLPEGWREAHDPVTHQPYYYNTVTQAKTWARPGVSGRPAANTVTATRLWSMEQPRNLQPGTGKHKRVSGPLNNAGGSTTHGGSVTNGGGVSGSVTSSKQHADGGACVSSAVSPVLGSVPHTPVQQEDLVPSAAPVAAAEQVQQPQQELQPQQQRLQQQPQQAPGTTAHPST